jgi:outer membrane protein TolC
MTDLLFPEVRAMLRNTEIGIDRDSLTSRKDNFVFLNWSFTLGDFARVRKTQMEAHLADLNWRDAMQTTAASVEMARASLDASGKRLSAAVDEYSAATSAQQSSVATYDAGLVSILDVFDAEEQLASANIAMASAIADYNNAQMNMRVARGSLTLADVMRERDK